MIEFKWRIGKEMAVILRLLVIEGILFVFGGCDSMYHRAMEKIGATSAT